MKRKNSWHTDLKWNSKKNLQSTKQKLEKLSYKWGEVDFLIVSMIDDVIAKLDEIEEEISLIDVKKF